MSMAAQRPFAAPTYPISPSPTTASSLGYSQYGSQSFSGVPPGRGLSVSSSAYGQPSSSAPSRSGTAAKTSDKRGESREVARTHWKALKEFLATWIERESPSARASAREKLTRLTKLQFQELSTDVYDELMRRMAAENGEDAAPFLPVREDFHPKRNQARQKLATLPGNRFKDLASDVFYELRRRFPEFDREEAQQRSYEEPPAPGPRPSTSQQSLAQSARSTPTPPPASVSRLVSTSTHQRQGSRNMSASTHNSRPSVDRNGRTVQNEPEEEFINDTNSRGQRRPQPNAMAATNDAVIPSKSRLKEEEIQVPYARDSTMEDLMRQSLEYRAESLGRGRDSQASYGASPSVEGDRSRTAVRPSIGDNSDVYSNRSNSYKNLNSLRSSQDEEREKRLRMEFESRISSLDTRLAAAERERDEARRAEEDEKTMRLEWEEEVRVLKEQSTTLAANLRSLQHDLTLARDQADAAKQRTDQANAHADEEVAQWRDRSEQLEDEYRRLENEKNALEDELDRGGGGGGVGDIKEELQSLVDELNSLSMTNDQLISQREMDATRLGEMESKVTEYKRKYDAVRIELRNLKATSTMFATLAKPVTDDHLPSSPDGNISDLNVSAFQNSIDGLLSAARSSTPSGVLPAMKAIVEAITSIGEDVKRFEAKPNLNVDVSRLESLKYESTNRLNSLMGAARNHAMASGLSPVSLLDAAAGHLSANVVEIIKLLKIKRSDKDLKRSSSRLSIKDMVNRDRERERANDTWDNNYSSDRAASRSEKRSESRAESRSGSRTERGSESRGPDLVVSRATPEKVQIAREPSRTGPRIDTRSDGARTASPLGTTGSGPKSSAPPSAYLSNSNFSPMSAASAPVSAPPSSFSKPSPIEAPQSANPTNTRPSDMRINSFQSTSTSRSDSFELDRKSSLRNGHSVSAHVESRDARTNGESQNERRESLGSTGTASSQGPMTTPGSGQPINSVVAAKPDQVDDDAREWEDLRPYLNAQSSSLVNSIQNLLAAIRTNSPPSVLNEHLSEVIAIASSIVAVSTNALPGSLRGQGDGLLKDLVNNTNKLSEAQEVGQQGGAQGFEKSLRQQIASASFGVAKSLKALMKLGGNE